MIFNEFKRIIETRPFKPVRIFITSGETVDIRHPAQLFVTRATFAFAIGRRNGEIKDMGWYSIIHVVKVVPLSALPRKKRKHRSA